METKVCSRCNTEKNKSMFYKAKDRPDGVRTLCKECDNYAKLTRRRTKDGHINQIYITQKAKSKDRGHNQPSYSKKELHDWLYSQEKYHVLYDNWKRLDFQKDYSPSVDRLDNKIGYTIANIQVVTWAENRALGNESVSDGNSTRKYIPVDMYTVDGEFIKSFFSGAEASREMGLHIANIHKCCKHDVHAVGGYVWEFSGNEFTKRDYKIKGGYNV